MPGEFGVFQRDWLMLVEEGRRETEFGDAEKKCSPRGGIRAGVIELAYDEGKALSRAPSWGRGSVNQLQELHRIDVCRIEYEGEHGRKACAAGSGRGHQRGCHFTKALLVS